eukprot:scaffold38939_cov62-Phaeocystis_antarctica.AAC.2
MMKRYEKKRQSLPRARSLRVFARSVADVVARKRDGADRARLLALEAARAARLAGLGLKAARALARRGWWRRGGGRGGGREGGRGGALDRGDARCGLRHLLNRRVAPPPPTGAAVEFGPDLA